MKHLSITIILAFLVLCAPALGAGSLPDHAAFVAAQAHAQTAKKTPVASTPTQTPAATPKLSATDAQANPLLILANMTTDDLNAALADANAQTPPDTIAANCYQELIALKNSPALALPTGKIIGAFTLIQKARDLKATLANIASPNGPLSQLNQSCAAWNTDNVATLLAVGAAAGIVAVPGGIPGVTAAATAGTAALSAQIAAFFAAIPK